MKVLALAAYPEQGASTRFRIAQYLPALAARGISVTLLTQLDAGAFAALYRPGSLIDKARLVLATAVKEAIDALAVAREADVIWVQREAALVGPEYLERFLALSGRPIVFDFDDAIWLKAPEDGAANPRWARWLRSPKKANRLLRLCKEAIAGSSVLAEHAEKIARSVTVVPTVVSRERWTPREHPQDGALTVGWVGSHSTAPALQIAAPALAELAADGHRFRVRVIGGPKGYAIPGVDVENVAFDLAIEVDAVRAFDIGIAPMPSGPWSDGKCGFKQLQYMALSVPCVTSAWAGARDFIRHEENALVASDHGSWKQALLRLLRDGELRAQLGRAGRDLVVSRYCAEVQIDTIAAVLSRAAR
ncbi:MAG: glycosyltransferase family 4 protein [Deltaproteobacteria bacterium]|nr:glycosyltransferase family 4 protein [Deltaproteobacteria bacterium]